MANQTVQIDSATEARIAEAAARGAAQTALGVGAAHARWLEAMRQAGIEPVAGRKLGVRPLIQQLAVSLGAPAPLVSSDSVSWSVPAQELLVIEEIRGLFFFEDAANEPAVIGTMVTTVAKELAYLKANNCKVNVVRGDTQIAITTPADVALSTMVPELGGQSLLMAREAPNYIIPGGQQITVRATLSDATAATYGFKARYGIVLIGTLLRP